MRVEMKVDFGVVVEHARDGQLAERRVAGHLQLRVVLIGPEPRRVAIRLVGAEHVARGDARLRFGAVPRDRKSVV